MSHREAKTNTEGSLTVSIGKPDKEGKRGVSAEIVVKKFEGESIQEYEDRYAYFHNKMMNEIQRVY